MKIKKSKNYSISDFLKNTMIIIPFMCAFGFLIHIDFSTNYFDMNNSTTSNLFEPVETFESFESSLFCPLSADHAHISTRLKYENIISDIYERQFNHSNCNIQNTNPQTKYFILSMDDINRDYGFMATINHIYLPPFTLSLFTNRIFLLSDNSDEKPYNYLHTNGKSIPKICEKRIGRNCFFKPVSNCNGQQIHSILLKAAKQNSLLVINDNSKYCTNSSKLHPNIFKEETKNYNVIYYKVWNIFQCELFDEHGPLQHDKNRGIIETMINKYNWNINFFEYTAIVFSFFMRLQNNINNMVINGVNKSLINYNYKSRKNTISLIMRGSDKCSDEEMFCFNAEEFMRISKLIIDRNENKLRDIIVTSEDKKMIEYVKNNYNLNNLGVNLIYNDYDDLPNTGNIGKLNDSIRFNEYKTFMFVIDLLTTFKLQMHSDYYIIQRQSNWAHGIWVMTNAFKDCGIYKLKKYSNDYNDYNENKACVDLQGLNKWWMVVIDGRPIQNDTRRIYWDNKSLNLQGNEKFNNSDFQLFLKSRIKTDNWYFNKTRKAPDILHEMYSDYHRCYKKHRFVWD